jgi:hypothetical protein
VGKSCLFANTNNGTSFNFVSLNNNSSSLPVSFKRRVSELSITYIFVIYMKVYQAICSFKIVSPIWPDCFLSSDIPDIKLEPVKGDSFDVESLRRTNICSFLISQSA